MFEQLCMLRHNGCNRSLRLFRVVRSFSSALTAVSQTVLIRLEIAKKPNRTLSQSSAKRITNLTVAKDWPACLAEGCQATARFYNMVALLELVDDESESSASN